MTTVNTQIDTGDLLTRKNHFLPKHLDASTKRARTQIFDDWNNILEEYGVPEADEALSCLNEALAKKWEGRPIVILLDEVSSPDTLLKCLIAHEERIPETVTIIAVVNPYGYDLLPNLPPFS